MIMYHHTKFACQRINSFIQYKSNFLFICALAVTLTLKIANNFFLHDTLAHDAASPYQVWQQNVLQFKRYHPDKCSLTFWTFAVTLPLTAVIPFFHRILQQLMMPYYQTKFSFKLTSSLEDKQILSYLDPISLCCDVDTEHSELIFLQDTLAYGAA